MGLSITPTELFNELATSDDSYKCLGISTSHITEDDSTRLEELCEDCDQIVERKFGFIIKFLEEAEDASSENYDHFNNVWGFPEVVVSLITVAYRAGYRAIEFDADAKVYSNLPTYDW